MYWQDGRLVPDALAEIDWHLRDFRTGDVHAIDPDLLDLLHRLGRAMAYDGPIHVISGYRSPKTNAMLAAQSGGVAKNSYHVRGMAIDLRAAGAIAARGAASRAGSGAWRRRLLSEIRFRACRYRPGAQLVGGRATTESSPLGHSACATMEEITEFHVSLTGIICVTCATLNRR